MNNHDCSQCHGQVDIIDSESGGFPAKCHCYAVRCGELRKHAESAESLLQRVELVLGDYEWLKEKNCRPMCRACCGFEQHESDCWLAALLAEIKEKR